MEELLKEARKAKKEWRVPLDQIMTVCPQCGQKSIDRDVCICGQALVETDPDTTILEDDKHISYESDI